LFKIHVIWGVDAMLAARGLYKSSWGSTFLLHKLVPVMLSSIGADTFKRFSSSDCVSAATTRLNVN
jgi:hypothetical protein